MGEAPRLIPCRTFSLTSRWTSGWWWVGLTLGMLFMAVILLGGLPGLLVTCALSVVWRAYVAHSSRVREAEDVELLPHGLRVSGPGLGHTFHTPGVREAYDLPDRRTVFIETREGQARIELGADESARVLSHLGRAAGQRALSAPLRGMIGAFMKGVVALFVGGLFPVVLVRIIGPIGGFVGLLTAAVFAAGVVKLFGFPRLVVGNDGVRVEGGFERRFLPYSDVTRVSAGGEGHAAGVLVDSSSRGRVVFSTIGQSSDQVAALVRRIEENIGAYRARDDRSVALLERRGRTAAEWCEDLKRAAVGHTSFREAAVGPEDLARKLADPGAPLEQRVGAALALRHVDPACVEKIRAVVDVTADPRVRIALQHVADPELDDEEAIRRALGDCPARAAP